MRRAVYSQSARDREKKKQLEKEALQKVFATLDDGNEYFRLWQEFEDDSSPEARLLKQLDKVEIAAQALDYEGKSSP